MLFFDLLLFAAACSALDYHGTSRRLFVGLASGVVSVSEEYLMHCSYLSVFLLLGYIIHLSTA